VLAAAAGVLALTAGLAGAGSGSLALDWTACVAVWTTLPTAEVTGEAGAWPVLAAVAGLLAGEPLTAGELAGGSLAAGVLAAGPLGAEVLAAAALGAGVLTGGALGAGVLAGGVLAAGALGAGVLAGEAAGAGVVAEGAEALVPLAAGGLAGADVAAAAVDETADADVADVAVEVVVETVEDTADVAVEATDGTAEGVAEDSVTGAAVVFTGIRAVPPDPEGVAGGTPGSGGSCAAPAGRAKITERIKASMKVAARPPQAHMQIRRDQVPTCLASPIRGRMGAFPSTARKPRQTLCYRAINLTM
jgi:hypothetical protein